MAAPQNFQEILDRGIVPGRDIRIAFGDGNISRCLLAAPNGGGIEPGTSELLRAVADLGNWAWYEFAGFLRKGNHENLHLDSTKFDEPTLLSLIPRTSFVVSLHGSRETDGAVARIGGSWDKGRASLAAGINAATSSHGIRAMEASDYGVEPTSITNRGKLGHGVQIELSRGARNLLFPPDCSREARGKRSPGLTALAKSIHSAIKQLAG